jgi:phosphoribosyl-AMP cyclohydrolase
MTNEDISVMVQDVYEKSNIFVGQVSKETLITLEVGSRIYIGKPYEGIAEILAGDKVDDAVILLGNLRKEDDWKYYPIDLKSPIRFEQAKPVITMNTYGDVKMFGFTNELAIENTLRTGYATYVKPAYIYMARGKTSGQRLKVISVRTNNETSSFIYVAQFQKSLNNQGSIM